MFLDLLAKDYQTVDGTDVRPNSVRLGAGPCTVCDCPGFVAAPGGSGHSCVGRNSAGGTCNHWDSEHT